MSKMKYGEDNRADQKILNAHPISGDSNRERLHRLREEIATAQALYSRAALECTHHLLDRVYKRGSDFDTLGKHAGSWERVECELCGVCLWSEEA